MSRKDMVVAHESSRLVDKLEQMEELQVRLLRLLEQYAEYCNEFEEGIRLS